MRSCTHNIIFLRQHVSCSFHITQQLLEICFKFCFCHRNYEFLLVILQTIQFSPKDMPAIPSHTTQQVLAIYFTVCVCHMSYELYVVVIQIIKYSSDNMPTGPSHLRHYYVLLHIEPQKHAMIGIMKSIKMMDSIILCN